MHLRPVRAAAVAGLTALVATLAAAPGAVTTSAAAADPAAPTAVLATDLLSPLSLAAGSDSVLWFSQNLNGSLMQLRPGQAATRVYQSRGNLLVGGVSVVGATTYFTLAGKAATYGRLMSITVGGKAKEVADLGAYEAAHNPDHAQHYGFRGLSASCAAAFTGATARYTGRVQTYPYDTLARGKTIYVVDSAANDILKVRGNGRISVVSVLPGVKTTMTTSYAKQHKLPRCTVGKTYRAEAVPTSLAAGPGGSLYVTSRAGGPATEGGGQARGAVWSLDPGNGHLTSVAKGLITPTGVAVAPDGDLYVAELFGGAIVRIPAGSTKAVPFAQVPFPGDVLATPGGLVATTNVLSGTSGKAGDPANADVVRYAYQ